ncbi:hypothetical protein AXG53_06300 [Stenotrophomonas sp. KCTC 12332]|nr:hypothetical protein AXG53_06300 [Stenotrophomonas sp. KCTC 12332]
MVADNGQRRTGLRLVVISTKVILIRSLPLGFMTRPLAFWCLNSFSTSKRDQDSFGKYLANSSQEEFLLVLIWLRMWYRQNMKYCFAPG